MYRDVRLSLFYLVMYFGLFYLLNQCLAGKDAPHTSNHMVETKTMDLQAKFRISDMMR